MKPLDRNVWQYHLGIIEGCLRAYGAPADVASSVTWIWQQVFEDEVEVEAAKRLDDRVRIAIESDEEKCGKWTPAQENDLRRYINSGADTESIANRFPRKPKKEVYAMIKKIENLSLDNSEDDDDI